MSCCIFRRVLAVIVVFALAGVGVPQSLVAGANGRLQGRVLDADGITPMTGVVVNLLDAGNRQTFSSIPTNEHGVFEAAAPAGSYRVVADTARGAYLAAGEVRVRDGRNPPISLTLRQAAPGEGGAPPAPGASSGKNSLPTWAKWTIVGGIVVGGLLVIDAVTKDESVSSGF